MYRIGIDLGGTSIKTALLDREGAIQQRSGAPTRSGEGYETVFRDMADCVNRCLATQGISQQELGGIGLATPGLLSEDGREILFASNLGFSHVRAVDELSRHFRCPITLANDADAAALGEHLCGAGKGSRSSVTITIGTGIGSGIILDNQIFPGAFRSGGEIGHHIVEANGLPCPCGQRGCLERYASASALVADGAKRAGENPRSLLHELCGGDLEQLNARHIYTAHDQGDTAATEAVERFIRYLGIGVINTVNILQPEVVIIGGGVSGEGEKLTQPLTAYIREHILLGEGNLRTSIRHALLGNDAGVVGAAALCL